MKRAIIVHGWGGSPQEPMHKWLRKELENKGYKVITPNMPNPERPQISSWVSHLKKTVDRLDEDTLLIGHSIGCQTIMRYLEKEKFDGKTNVIFIAGWFNLENIAGEDKEDIRKPWIEGKINFNEIKKKIAKLTVFLSSNEPYGFVKSNKNMFEKKLGAKVIILKNMGHFTEDTGVNKLPEILPYIK